MLLCHREKRIKTHNLNQSPVKPVGGFLLSSSVLDLVDRFLKYKASHIVQEIFHAVDTYNEIFYSFFFPRFGLENILELIVAKLWAELDSELNFEDTSLVFSCLLQDIISFSSALGYLQDKGFCTRNRTADGNGLRG